jgi:hypothetical protein
VKLLIFIFLIIILLVAVLSITADSKSVSFEPENVVELIGEFGGKLVVDLDSKLYMYRSHSGEKELTGEFRVKFRGGRKLLLRDTYKNKDLRIEIDVWTHEASGRVAEKTCLLIDGKEFCDFLLFEDFGLQVLRPPGGLTGSN